MYTIKMVFAERMLHFTKLSMQAPEEEKKAEREEKHEIL